MKRISLPDYYELDTRPVPVEMGMPSDASIYGMRTQTSSGMLIIFPVSEKESMPFDNDRAIIDSLHESLTGENEGLVEVGHGTTKNGFPYVYDIIKHRMVGEQGIPLGMEYTINLNLKFPDEIGYINGSFMEEGISGVRESIVLEMYSREKGSMDEAFRSWMEDPYDKDFKQGMLRNYSERSEVDALFPDHPLSLVRELISYIRDNN